MGLGMPKFLVNGYNSFKESCISMKESYNNLKEGLNMVKTVFSVVKKLDTANFGTTKDPQAFADAINNTEGVPEAYKTLLSGFDKETLSKMTQIFFDSMKNKNKSNGTISGENSTNENGRPSIDFQKLAESMFDSLKPKGNEDRNENSVEEKGSSSNSSESRAQNTGPNRQETEMETETRDPRETNDPTSHTTDYKTTKEYNRDYDPDYIPNETYRDIMNKSNEFENRYKSTNESQNTDRTINQNNSRKTNEAFNNKTYSSRPNLKFNQNDSTRQNQEQDSKRNVGPMANFLKDELQKRFGPNWKQHIPSFVTNPESAGPPPDLGLGLDKNGNRDIVKHLSKVLKDIM